MPLIWQGWEADPTADPAGGQFRTPYMDWYMTTDLHPEAADAVGVLGHGVCAGASGRPFPFALPDLPLPRRAIRPGATALPVPAPRADVRAGLACPPGADDVIIGIIDAGLAPAHERFRRTGGIGTRVLSFWQQGGPCTGQPHLPFGRELTQRELDALMGPDPAVDEARFTRAAGLADFANLLSERWVETQAPHGTHVADLAAGCDPDAPAMARLRDRAHLIMVELAPRVSIGPSGSFLETYVIWAIRHIVATADAIWAACHPGHPRKGFPIAINLSYGLHAGPKDGTMAVQKFIRVLNAGRPASAPIRLVLPAGNDNLDRCSAGLAARASGETRSLDLRVQPEDRTSSYAEVWPEPLPASAGPGRIARPGRIGITPPIGPALPPGSTDPAPGQRCDLVDTATGQAVARIYCRQSDSRTGQPGLDGEVHGSVGYILCVAPTWRQNGPAAPSGAWRITLAEGPEARLYVQSDQPLVPTGSSSLLPYFEDVEDTPPALLYAAHDADGRLRDSYAFNYRTETVTDTEPPGATSPIRRQNTVNAIACSYGTLTIAGYRASDGWPAAYSGTARGTPVGSGTDPDDPGGSWPAASGAKARMEAAAISDDGLWRIGRLAAGGRSGSAVVMQGTSFATGEATRLVAGLLLDWLDAGAPAGVVPASAPHLRQVAAAGDAAAVAAAAPMVAMPPATALSDKLGSGRLPRQDHGRMAR